MIRFGTFLMASASSALLSTAAFAADTYVMDKGHTEVFFGWSHAGVSMQHGEFTSVDGTLTLDAEAPETSKIRVTIDTNSIATGVPALDEHLRSSDFLNVQKYPQITFESTTIEVTGETTAKLTGDLTIHGVTQPVVLDTTLTHQGPHPVADFIYSYRGEWVAFHAKTQINHRDFNVGPYSTGPIFIEINTELQRK